MAKPDSAPVNLLRRAPTMDDVAREAGVSRALVSLVMRGQPNVSQAKRSLVLDAAAQLGYRPNAMARSLASRRTKTIGVILDDLRNPFFAEIVDGIEALASEDGYQVLLGVGGRQPRRERAAVINLLEYRVDGLILVSSRMPVSDIRTAAGEVPMVMVGRRCRDVDADLVIIDESRGVELVLEHLIALGHRRITHIDGGSGAGGPQRRTAFMREMRRQRLAGTAEVIPGDFIEGAGAEAARVMLEASSLPTAVFAANDLVATGVLGEFDRAGVRVPEDVSIVGYDDISVARLPRISLTTVHQPRPAMGRMAFELLIDRIHRRRANIVRLVEPSLIVRSTTAPARAADTEPASVRTLPLRSATA
jgi:DNA-binding LacI/PurR family transcriptional regulator